MIDKQILLSVVISQAIICFNAQTSVWLPTPVESDDEHSCKDLGRTLIGKFTQGGAYDHKRHHSRLIMDVEEFKFIIADTTEKNTFCIREDIMLSTGKLRTVVSYINGDSPQYAHLRSYMLAYVSIHLLSMVNRVPLYAVRVATDSIYINEEHLPALDKFMTTTSNWGTWRVKKELLHVYCRSADVEIEDEYRKSTTPLTTSLLPSVVDPVVRVRTVYLNGPGGCGKTTRAIELFRNSDMTVLTPTHRLAREMIHRGVKACTYHSFFKYSGGTWTPERMGTKYIPEKIIWDEIDNVPLDTLKQFLEWLLTKNTAVVMCGDHGQPPPFIGESPREMLKEFVDYYEEIRDNIRTLDEPLK